MATPAHLAQTVTAELGPEAQWKPAPHLELINRHIVDACTDTVQRFVDIEVSVRHGKSYLVSWFLPVWYLGLYPDRTVFLLSYNEEKAAEWGEATREVMAQFGYELFGLRVDPNTKSKTHWKLKGRKGEVIATGVDGTITGKGCLPAGEIVDTIDGPVPIDVLHRREPGTPVLSWNHDAERAEWREVQASREIHSTEIIELVTTTGRVLRCTPDHRVHVPESGYRQAGDLGVGDPVLVIAPQQALPALRGRERRARRCLSGVLARVVRPVRASHLRRVPSGVLAQAMRAPARCADLLLGRMSGLLDVAHPHGSASLRAMPSPHGREASALLHGLPLPRPSFADPNGLPRLRDHLPAAAKPSNLLLESVRESRPLVTDDREGQLPFSIRRQLRQSLRPGSSSRHQAGWWVCRVLGVIRADRPSHQRGHQEQPAGEPHHPVPVAPCDPPQVIRDTVAVVRRTRTPSQPVYDIQVEGNHNFFGSGVLVHNCGLAVIDDPIKNREEADSPTIRRKRKEGYYSNVRTRLAPFGTVVLAMARWRWDDLSGEVVHGYGQERKAGQDIDVVSEDRWEVIRLPAIAEAPDELDDDARAEWRDELGRKEGDPLWPEQWPLHVLEQLRATFMANDPQTWDSLYQQRPAPRGGGEFPKDQWQIIPHRDTAGLRLVRWWDLAATKDGGDWTVGTLVGIDDQNLIYVLDVQRVRRSASEVERLVKGIAAADGKLVPIRIEQSKDGAGKALIDSYVRMLVGYDVAGVRPEGDKEQRAAPAAAQQQLGNIYLVRGEWNQAWIDEHAAFPRGRNDDQVDTLSGAVGFLSSRGAAVMETDWMLNTPLAAMYGNAVRSRRVIADPIGAANARFGR